MSEETRQKLVDHPRLVLQRHSQKTDILDPTKTNTWLIQFLLSLVQSCSTPFMITALYTDHDPGTWHHPSNGSPGRAVDGWNADWASAGDDAVRFVMQAAAYISVSNNPKLIEVGVSGDAVKYKDAFNWNCDNVFVEQTDEHVHFAVGIPT